MVGLKFEKTLGEIILLLPEMKSSNLKSCEIGISTMIINYEFFDLILDSLKDNLIVKNPSDSLVKFSLFLETNFYFL